MNNGRLVWVLGVVLVIIILFLGPKLFPNINDPHSAAGPIYLFVILGVLIIATVIAWIMSGRK